MYHRVERRINWAGLAGLIVFLIGVVCEGSELELKMDVKLAVEHQTGFTLDLYKKVVQKSTGDEGNSVSSPFSIATALAMAAAGAKGETLKELTSVLKLPEGEALHDFTSQLKVGVLKDGSGEGGPMISFANGLWVDKSMSLRPKFEALVKGSYGAEIRTADFGNKAEEERTAINSWVSDETKGLIKDLLPPNSLDAMTSLILANALYFKGAWQKPFDSSRTSNEDFHLLSGKTVSVPFLGSMSKQYIRKFDTYNVLRLPYQAGKDHRSFSMYIVLPHDKAGLPDVEKNLDAKSLTEDCVGESSKVEVGKFGLPKFKISTGFSVPDSLVSLGLNAPFIKGQADFSDMVEGPAVKPLYISDVVHKSFIEVNEAGTEAAAATAIEIMLMCYTPPEVDFVADHPFLFILKEDVSGVILFIGRITDPSLSE